LTLFVKAYEDVAQKEEREWILLSSIGTVLKLFAAPFCPEVYGHKNLLTFVKAYPDHFETRRQASKGKPVLVRRRRGPSPLVGKSDSVTNTEDRKKGEAHSPFDEE
jgi:hypothetical protein